MRRRVRTGVLVAGAIVTASLSAFAAYRIVVPWVLVVRLGDETARAAAAASTCCSNEDALFGDLLEARLDLSAPSNDVELARLVRRARLETPAPTYLPRDLSAFPLGGFPGLGAEPLLACDADAPDHPAEIHVLFDDGEVRAVALPSPVEPGSELVVGPGSPVPELRKLRRD